MTRLRTAALALFASTALLGCGGDNPSGPSGTVSIVSGDGQTGAVGAALQAPFTVEVRDQGGSPVNGQSVNWVLAAAAGPNASLSAPTTVTGADGRASVTFTLGDAVGTYQVRGSVGGSSVTFSADAGAVCDGDGSAVVLDLAPGEDAVIGGASVGCVQLSAHAGEAEYEVIVTPLPQTLGFTDMQLSIAGADGAAPVARRSSPVSYSHGFQALGGGVVPADWRRTRYEWDMHLRELERPLRSAVRTAAPMDGAFGLMAAPPVVGDVTDFGFSCIDTGTYPGAPETITAEVTYVSTTAVIYEDTLSRGSFLQAEYAAIGTNFDDYTTPTAQLYFGTPSDLPGDPTPGQVIILYTQGVNQLNDDYRTGYIGGFFCPQDAGFAGGNNAKMFYLLVPDPDGEFTPAAGDDGVMTKPTALRLTDNTAAHEYQHLINFIEGSGAAAEIGINEGLSHEAEEVVGHAVAQGQGLTRFMPGNEIGPSDVLASAATVDLFNTWYLGNWQNLGLYLAAPSDTAALLNSVDPLGLSTFRMRGTNWMFIRYLLDRFGTPATEWQLTRALITDGADNTRDAIANVFGVPYEQLVADWSAMLVVEDTGLAVRDDLALSSYQMRALYNDPNIGAAISVTGDWPLTPASYGLGVTAVVPMDLFTATSAYVTLGSAEASGPTGLRLSMAGTGDDVDLAIMPYMVIVRTK